MSPWENWVEENNNYSRPGKRRIDEVNCEIETIKQELNMNDFILKNELEMRLSSEYDRALVAAELYKDRLLTLARSSRSQILHVSMDTGLNNNPYQENGGWNPRRTKYNQEEDSYYNYSNQYAAPQNSWSGYSYRNNAHYSHNRAAANRRNRKRKAPQTYRSLVQPTPVNTEVKTATVPVKTTTAPVKTTTAPVKTTTAPVKTTTAPVKTTTAPDKKQNGVPKTPTDSVKLSPSATKPVAVVKTFTAKNNLANKTAGQIVAVKTEFFNHDPNSSSLVFSDRIITKSKNIRTVTTNKINSPVVVKIEPNDSVNSMQDDLENHI